MITTTRGLLRSEPFKTSIQKLINAPGLETKVAYNVVRLAKEVEKTLIELQKEWIQLVGKYVETDGSQWKLNEEKTDFAYLAGVDVEDAKKAIMEYMGTKAEISREPLKLEDLGPARLTPADISVLEPFLVLPEV
jgi:septum formation topological specificity factor MinE